MFGNSHLMNMIPFALELSENPKYSVTMWFPENEQLIDMLNGTNVKAIKVP